MTNTAKLLKGNRGVSLSIFILLLYLLTGIPNLHAQPQDCDFSTEDISLVTTAERVPISYTIALDKIGIFVGGPDPGSTTQALLRALGGEISQSYDGGLVVIRLFAPLCRKNLEVKVRNLRNQAGILQAGLVLYGEGSKYPLLVTNQLIIGFNSTPKLGFVDNFAQSFDITPVESNSFIETHWLFTVNESSGRDVLDIAQQLSGHVAVDFAIPDFIQKIFTRQFVPNDPFFGEQWHHQNTGQVSGTTDADIDSELAWSITLGNENTIIAILDTGFEIDHEDLEPNLWVNQNEFPPGHPADGGDDDNNNCLDDINGCNFTECVYGTQPPCGSGTFVATYTSPDGDLVSVTEHGTAVAGVAAGRGNNEIGISGACPLCSIMPIQVARFQNAWGVSKAITYAGEMNANILNNSWGYDGGNVPTVVTDAVNATAQAGTVIFWASGNTSVDTCAQNTPDIIVNPNVISVGASSNYDRKVTESAYGDCLDLTAPSYSGYGQYPKQPVDPNKPPIPGYPNVGTLNMVTTDRMRAEGWNDTTRPNTLVGYDPSFCTTDIVNKNYTQCFSGTSAAAPVAAGIAGLILSADNTLDRVKVQRLLQDTADKIEPSLAHYRETDGYSFHSSSSTHAYGRVNAFEAVRIIAPATSGNSPGLNGTDIFLRDNSLDWGNTSQYVSPGWPGWAGSNVLMEQVRGFIPHYQSVDIKVDAPPFQTPPTTSLEFDAFTHEDPISLEANKVYVRAHNRGPASADNVRVKLHWAMAGTALPALPNDFWSAWPGDSTSPANPWHTIGSQTISQLNYSGASVAGTGTDASEIVSFNFTGPQLNPSLPAFRHYCLFAVIDSIKDPVNETRLVPDIVTPTNNNVTHLNVSVNNPIESNSLNGLFIRNPLTYPITTRVTFTNPKSWDASMGEFSHERAFELAAGKEIPIVVNINTDKTSGKGEVEVRQEILVKENYLPMGGFIFRFSSN